MAALDKNYLAALERTLAAATSAGKLEDAIALRAEKQRLEKEESMPTAQEEGALAAAPMLKELRKTYRGTAAQYDAARIQTLHTLCDKYDQALAVFQTELTKAAKLDDALHVKNVRDRLAETKNKGFPSPAMHAAASNKRSMTFTNSLGMKFVPVPDTEVMFCIHETRRQDYAAYAAEAPGVDDIWKNQQMGGIPAGNKDDHPVVGMNWEDAQKFCAWLSKKEGKTYRLPTDQEWSCAAALGMRRSGRRTRRRKCLAAR
jgi:formylglycine-generating enzyme required for sulfatase activity